MDYYQIGQRIRKYRKALGLSQDALAERVGISTTHMSHIETGNTKLSLQVFADIAAALDVRADELLYDAAHLAEASAEKNSNQFYQSLSFKDPCLARKAAAAGPVCNMEFRPA